MNTSEVLQGYADLQAFEAVNPGMRLPVRNSLGKELTSAQDSKALLAIAIMRTLDVMEPQTPALWEGIPERPTLGVALGDLLGALTREATYDGISIVGATHAVIAKLAQRERQPHVVRQVRASEKIDSRRERLHIVPWVAALMLGTATANTANPE